MIFFGKWRSGNRKHLSDLHFFGSVLRHLSIIFGIDLLFILFLLDLIQCCKLNKITVCH